MRGRWLIIGLVSAVSLGIAVTAFGRTIPEVRPFVGAFVPTGAQRDVLKDTWLVGGQGALEIADMAHLVGTFAWAPNRTSHDVCVYDYNVGLEGFQRVPMSADWQLRPFLGLGLGGRTYVDHANNSHKETTFGGYGALGTEFQIARIAFRLEGRDYVSRFAGLDGNQKAKARNDMSFATAVAFHW